MFIYDKRRAYFRAQLAAIPMPRLHAPEPRRTEKLSPKSPRPPHPNNAKPLRKQHKGKTPARGFLVL